MRFSLFLLVLVFGQTSFASSSFVGDWCKRYDDFTKAYKITLSDDGGLDVKEWTVGNQSGENHGYSQGYISMGGSSLVFEMDGIDMGATDIVKFYSPRLGKDRLRFTFIDRPRETFSRCKIRYK